MLRLTLTALLVTLVAATVAGCVADPTQDSSYVPPGSGEEEQLQHGYSRIGKYVLFKGERIDRAGRSAFRMFVREAPRGMKMPQNPDGESFEVLNEQYTKDKNMVYYKWVSPGRFWVIELPEADPKTMEVVSGNLAKDKSQVFWYGELLKDLDPETLEIVNRNFVWKDSKSVWYQHSKIADADAKTFEHIGQAFYKDKNRVYWSTTPLEGADPRTFRAFGENVAYGADKNSVWFAKKRMPKLDPATFGVVQHTVYKDKTGVYCHGVLIEGANPKTMGKVAELDEFMTALLSDGESYFIYVPYWNEVYRIEPKKNWLRVSKDVWEIKDPIREKVGTMSVLLTKLGWQKLQAPESKRWGKNYWEQREATTLSRNKDRFKKAWELITGKEKEIGESREFARIMNTPIDYDYKVPTGDDFDVLRKYRATQRTFDGYFRMWLELNPKLKRQIEGGKNIDAAALYGAEMFGLTESKMPAGDLLTWKDVGTGLLLDMVQVRRRRLRPPVPECPMLRTELIEQAEKLVGDNAKAEEMIDKQIDKSRVHFPRFLALKPADEKRLSGGKALKGADERIRVAKALLDEYEITVSTLTKQLLNQRNDLNPIQTELLAQLLTAEAEAAKAALVK